MAVPVLVTAGRSFVVSTNINADSVTIPTPSGLQVGDLLIAFVSQQQVTSSDASMVQPSGWTRIDTYRSGQRGVCVAIKALKTAGDVSAQAASQTWTNAAATTGGRFGGAMYRITGADLDAPLDGTPAAWTPLSYSGSPSHHQLRIH